MHHSGYPRRRPAAQTSKFLQLKCSIPGIDIMRIGLAACIAMLGSTAALPGIAASPAEPIPRQQQLADLAAFRQEFLAVDRSYAPGARRAAERRLSALERNAGQLSATAFNVEICRLAALADNGHTTCYVRGDAAGLGFESLGNEFYVLRAATAHAELLGARLLAIDGRSIRRVRRTVRSLAGGVPAHRDLTAASILSKPGVLHALGITRRPETATYRLQLPDGRVIERELATEGPADWSRFQPEHASWASQEPNDPFRWRDAADIDAIVIQLRQNMDRGDRRIAAFLEEAESARARLGRRNVVLDMRWNPGGNFLQTRDFLLAWPQRLPAPGRFYVLIGPSTFSAGIASVAYLKQAAGERVTLIGAPVGDRLMFFAENNRPVRLPHSGIVLVPALQRDDFRDGCRHYDDCLVVLAQPGAPHGTPPDKAAQLDAVFGRRPLQVRSLAPDVSAPWTMQTYRVGRDPAIEAIAQAVRGAPLGAAK
jgi:hypothetical protein